MPTWMKVSVCAAVLCFVFVTFDRCYKAYYGTPKRTKIDSVTAIIGLNGNGKPFMTITNIIEVTNCSPHCQGVVFVNNGMTNVFHAWMINVDLKTNYLLERKR